MSSNDRLLAAGFEAERQMHFYLSRAFGRKDDIMVFANLRFPTENDACQIDHLVMHRWGLVIVESKSVSGEIEVNEHEEWTRRSGGRVQGMPSPVLQARRQGQFLIGLLQDNREELRRKVLGLLQGGFKSCPVDIFVAISDHGRIKRHGANPPELKKADQIPHEIEEMIKRYRKGSGLLRGAFSNDTLWEMGLEEMVRVRDFLLERHQLRSATVAAADALPPRLTADEGLNDMQAISVSSPSADSGQRAAASPTSAADHLVPICRHCASGDVCIAYGRGPKPYYLRCSQCGKSTQLEWVCKTCGGEARIRKSGLEFTRWCVNPSCGFEELVFTNPSEPRPGTVVGRHSDVQRV